LFVYTFSSLSCTGFASWFIFFNFLSFSDTHRVGLQSVFIDLLQYPPQSFLFEISRLLLCRQIIWQSQQQSLTKSKILPQAAANVVDVVGRRDQSMSQHRRF
jgi:hypothetical protein